MNKIYESELNQSILIFVQSLVSLDPEMNDIGTVINQKVTLHEDDFSYGSIIMKINNISQKLLECYNILGETAGEINLCIKRLRNVPDTSTLNSFIEDYPRYIEEFADLINTHINFVKSIKKSIIDWNNVYKESDQISHIDRTIFDYVNSLEGSAGFYNKITNSINEYLEINN
jgi:hypothetical protein